MPPPATAVPPAAARGQLACVLVEDQTMFLDLLAAMIAIHGGIRIVAKVRDVAGGCDACAKHRPDVLILDLGLPDGDGLEVARRFVDTNPRGRVLIVSCHADEFVAPAWLNDNLHAVIGKEQAFEALSRELDDLTGTAGRAAGDEIAITLFSPREAEIFGLMGDGLTSRVIAKRLGLSEHTVQSHRKKIAQKLGTTGDEALRRAIAHRTRFFPGAGG